MRPPLFLPHAAGGGLIPARLLRSGFKSKTGKTLPIQVIGAVRYDDDNGKVHDTVTRTQWLSPDLQLSGQRILLVRAAWVGTLHLVRRRAATVLPSSPSPPCRWASPPALRLRRRACPYLLFQVDEVDDSRKTLAFIVDEMVRYLDQVSSTGSPTLLGACGALLITTPRQWVRRRWPSRRRGPITRRQARPSRGWSLSWRRTCCTTRQAEGETLVRAAQPSAAQPCHFRNPRGGGTGGNLRTERRRASAPGRSRSILAPSTAWAA